jgi:hypothetical protein
MAFIDLSHLTPAEKQMIFDGPALAPPPGVVPNFDDPPNKNYLGILANVVCLATTFVVVFLRAYAKIFCMKKVHIEDCKLARRWLKA